MSFPTARAYLLRRCGPLGLASSLFFLFADPASAQVPNVNERSSSKSEALGPKVSEELKISASPWWTGELLLAVGSDYSSGDYGQAQNTDMLYSTFSFAYLFEEIAMTPWGEDQLELKMTMSYLRIRGEDSVLPGGDVLDETSVQRRSDHGLGDIYLRTSYIWIPRSKFSPLFELGVLVKVPTASTSKRLGTGKTDVTFDFGVAKRFGNWSPFASAGYRFAESSPELDLDNRWLTSVGVTYSLSERWSFGLAYDYREAATAHSYSSGELVPYASIRLSQGVRLEPYMAIGTSRGNPKYAAGFQVRWAKPIP